MKRHLPLCLAVSVVVAGCVTHAPVSATLMFHDPGARHVHRTTSGFGFNGTYSRGQGLSLDYVKSTYPQWDYRARDLLVNSRFMSGGLYYGYFDPGGRLGLAVTLGFFVAGVDATVRLSDRTYLTGALSGPEQGRVTLQRRVLNTARFGGAVGATYQRILINFALPSECVLCGHDGESLHSFGASSFFMVRSDGGPSTGLKVGAYLGYVPSLRRAALFWSLAAGRF